MILRVGSRPSPLALAQSEIATRAIRTAAASNGIECDVRVVPVATTGDRVTDRPFRAMGAKGIFTSELQRAVDSGEVDAAVHSLKDLAATEPPGLVVAAVPAREDSRDVLVCPRFGRLEDVPPGSVVGTSSIRRVAQLGCLRPDLRTAMLRGNVGTRIAKVDAGEVDAAILAGAGLIRLGLRDRITQWLDPHDFVPAPGQGAIAIETAAGRLAGDLAWIAAADHAATRREVTAERACMAELEGGCTVALGVRAWIHDVQLHCSAFISSGDGKRALRASASGPSDRAAGVGLEVARALLEAGAAQLRGELRG
ncbi:MAG TPA: hydroxymethylbilane synthase [Actinomycetota bacterium]|nr:hydroxymethylbilane synthase [Actinomycetota bacterium]